MPRFFFFAAALLPLLLYARTVTFDYVRADDADLIAGNQRFLTDLRNIPRAFTQSYFETENELGDLKTYYRPLAIVSFMLDAARAGADPGAYHATNATLHALATCLLLCLAHAWGAAPLAALAAALVCAVHPVNVQAVTWIAGRNDLLLAVFGLLSLLAWNRVRLGSGIGGLALHVLAFACALFSKEPGIFLPAIAVLHQCLVVRTPLTRTQKVALCFDGLVMIAWAVLRTQALAGSPARPTFGTLRIAIANAPQVLVHFGKLLIPFRLNVSPSVDVTAIVLGVIAVAVFALTASRWRPRAMAIVGVCWALAFLLPTLMVPGLPIYEHRAYVPLIGILVCAAVAFAGRRAVWTAVGVAVVLITFATLTYWRQEVFRDAFAYWTDATRDLQFAPIAHVNLGQLHEAAENPQQARREYLRALALDPHTPKAHNNLGVVLMKLNEPELAAQHFREEARRHPSNADAWFNLGLSAELRGDAAEARGHYERAIVENRFYLPAYEKLGRTPPDR